MLVLIEYVDGANIEIAEEVGESNVCESIVFHLNRVSLTGRIVFFGHLTPAVEDLRYQHMYHAQPIEQKCPSLARVLDEVSAGRFGDGSTYEPLLNTVRNTDYYLLTEDFDSCMFYTT